MKPRFSIIIPAYNEEKYIEKTLLSLRNQTVSQKQIEIIIALSDKTTDTTDKIAKRFHVKVVRAPHGLGRQRRAGYEAATGEIFVGTDADTTQPDTWLSFIDTDMKDDIVCVTGPILLATDASKRLKRAHAFSMWVYYMTGKIRGKTYFSGANFAIRADIYKKSGGFNPALLVGEDTELSNRIQKLGRTSYDKRIFVTTSTRRLRHGFLRAIFDYTKVFFLVKLQKTPPEIPNYR